MKLDDSAMTLPKTDKAVIPIGKFTDYDLDAKNRKGKHVAFESALGYNLNNVGLLTDNIKNNLSEFSAISRGYNRFGEIYAVLMRLIGKTPYALTLWIDDQQINEIRLTSVYIKKEKAMTMIKQHQKVSLNNGRDAVLVEILGKGEAFIADIEMSEGDDETDAIYSKDIKSVFVEVERPFAGMSYAGEII